MSNRGSVLGWRPASTLGLLQFGHKLSTHGSLSRKRIEASRVTCPWLIVHVNLEYWLGWLRNSDTIDTNPRYRLHGLRCLLESISSRMECIHDRSRLLQILWLFWWLLLFHAGVDRSELIDDTFVCAGSSFRAISRVHFTFLRSWKCSHFVASKMCRAGVEPRVLLFADSATIDIKLKACARLKSIAPVLMCFARAFNSIAAIDF